MRSRKLLAAILVFVLAAPAVLIALRVLLPRDAPAAAPRANQVVVFVGAPGWTGARTCPVTREPRCDSEWTHESGQLVSVTLFDVADPRVLAGFVDRLAKEVAGRGGLVDRFTQNGMQLVRTLQEVDGGNALINYALVPPEQNAVFNISSLVPFDQQREADERIRTLLEHASWAAR